MAAPPFLSGARISCEKKHKRQHSSSDFFFSLDGEAGGCERSLRSLGQRSGLSGTIPSLYLYSSRTTTKHTFPTQHSKQAVNTTRFLSRRNRTPKRAKDRAALPTNVGGCQREQASNIRAVKNRSGGNGGSCALPFRRCAQEQRGRMSERKVGGDEIRL